MFADENLTEIGFDAPTGLTADLKGVVLNDDAVNALELSGSLIKEMKRMSSAERVIMVVNRKTEEMKMRSGRSRWQEWQGRVEGGRGDSEDDGRWVMVMDRCDG
jgi:hypothetical protein